MSQAGIAVTVLCADTGRVLDQVLKSLAMQTRRPVEILVSDLASTDLYTRQVLAGLERNGQRVVRRRDKNVAAAANAGVTMTSAQCVLVMDADVLPETTYLEKASACLMGSVAIAGVSEQAASSNEPHPIGMSAFIDFIARGVAPRFSVFRREAWTAIGGFDERSEGAEELDFWTSLLERGYSGAVFACGQPKTSRKLWLPVDLELFYRKHVGVLVGFTERLLLAKERTIVDERRRGEDLEKRRSSLRTELTDVQREIERIRGELSASGIRPVDFGDLHRTQPISPLWGLDRGRPLDRHYILNFLERHQLDVSGRVLEVKDGGYTRQFGGDRVAAIDVLDIDRRNEQATIVADLTRAESVADDTYDCFILTQVLGLIYDVPAALATAYRVLKPGGVLLCTVPAAGRISYEGPGLDGDFWRFTEASIRRLFADTFPIDGFEITPFGNVLANAAFLYGLAPHELAREELDATDPYFPVVYGIRAVKPARPDVVVGRGAQPARRLASPRSPAAAVLMYHGIASRSSHARGGAVSVDHFTSHMRMLRDEKYEVLPLRDVPARLASGELPDRAVAISLDDGYADALACGAPVLSDYGYPATLFIASEALEGSCEFWWDTLERVFTAELPLPNELRIALPSGPLALPTRTAEERIRALRDLTQTLFRLAHADRVDVMREISTWSGGMRLPIEARAMTSSELLEFARMPGIEIGSHTRNHVWLPAETRSQQVSEIVESKAMLEKVLTRSVVGFAYPHGGYDAGSVDLVRTAGYEYAVTTEHGLVDARSNPFLLPRIEIRESDGRMFLDQLRAMFEERVAATEPR